MTNPTENIIIDEDNTVDVPDDMADELAYRAAAAFEVAVEASNAFDLDYEPSIEREGLYW